MRNYNVLKNMLLAGFFCASVLSMGIKVQRDYDGNITLEALKSTEAKAATSEGHLIAVTCMNGDKIYGYGNSCALTSTSECIPNGCGN